MGLNIKIVPSRLVQQPDRIPFIDFVNNVGDVPISLKVLSGAVVTFSSTTQSNILSVNPSNTNISGYTLNIKNFMSVGGIQILNKVRQEM
jgi:hypothetical protein